MNNTTFAPRLLDWFQTNGRHDLPWQQHRTNTPDAYQVWLSEVMLQQTQVTTVIPYFLRFMQSFPTIQQLAQADWNTVAEHWAGLGYYARARNLHKGAKQLVDIIETTGKFPQTVAEWEQISGVGQSTAGAIVAMGLHGYGVICDGNVKRVLTRWAGIDGDITKSATNKQLWALAEALTPNDNSGHFAQAMMDMGATVCNRTKPACLNLDVNNGCPLQADCVAFATNQQLALPFKAKKQAKPSKYSQALFIHNPQGQILWLQRPDTGIWGGLWCLPLRFKQKTAGKKIVQTATNDDTYDKEYTTAEQIIDTFLANLPNGMPNSICLTNATKTSHTNNQAEENKPIKHTLTHFHWYLSSHDIQLTNTQITTLTKQLETAFVSFKWRTKAEAIHTLALPKAMLKLLPQT